MSFSSGLGKPPREQLCPHRLHAELADGVVHEHDAILHRHTDIPVGPAALVRPVLVTLLLHKTTGNFRTLTLLSLPGARGVV